jgi:16S rRNA U516 pseudouridylate synthase RsuA-like enzyme
MLLITDDKDLAQKLTHPSHGIKKYYEALVSQPPADKGICQLLKWIEDGVNF